MFSGPKARELPKPDFSKGSIRGSVGMSALAGKRACCATTYANDLASTANWFDASALLSEMQPPSSSTRYTNRMGSKVLASFEASWYLTRSSSMTGQLRF